MPIYEYQCENCALRYEKIIFRSDAPPPPCPNCGSEKVHKLISVPGACGAAATSGGFSSSGGSSSSGCGSGFS
ncbi:MAG: zinc ribbon domain-containing protein [Acidobacteriota bacterium]